MKRIQIGDVVESDYGRGRVLAVTAQWIIHDNSLKESKQEFAILLSDDAIKVVDENL